MAPLGNEIRFGDFPASAASFPADPGVTFIFFNVSVTCMYVLMVSLPEVTGERG